MFTSRKTIENLEQRIADLLDRVNRLERELDLARPLLTHEAHVTQVAAKLEGIALAAKAACAEVEGRASEMGVHEPRRRVPLGAVQRAKVTGYVALYFNGGWNDEVKLLVGTEGPTECVAQANSINDINSYAGGIVRAGEFWKVETKVGGGKSGFECVFTPLR
jgi:hypothetical protein